MDSLAAAMAALEATPAAVRRAVVWTDAADKVLRACYEKRVSRENAARIVGIALGRTISWEPVRQRAIALGIH